jgi:RNase P subunit RPR2
MFCENCHRPLIQDNQQVVTMSDAAGSKIVCSDDRGCIAHQLKYNPIPRVTEMAKRFAGGNYAG